MAGSCWFSGCRLRRLLGTEDEANGILQQVSPVSGKGDYGPLRPNAIVTNRRTVWVVAVLDDAPRTQFVEIGSGVTVTQCWRAGAVDYMRMSRNLPALILSGTAARDAQKLGSQF